MGLAKTGRRLAEDGSPYRAQRLAEDGSPHRAGWKCCQCGGGRVDGRESDGICLLS